MKTMLRMFLLLSLVSSSMPMLGRHNDINAGDKNKTAQPTGVLAQCARASAQIELSLNNVRAQYHTGGIMWNDRSKGGFNAGYEIPKGSGKTSLFSGALWIGGTDINNQQRVAAVQFRAKGDDFWTGPLTNDNTASISAQECAKYDRFFGVTKEEVEEFNAWFQSGQQTPQDYQIPRSILDWPAHGDVSQNQEYNLAPFYDRDNNNIYEPSQGDYPYYDLYNKRVCNTLGDCKIGQPLYGDETLWWVFNDNGNIHTESGGLAIGMEIRGQAFAFLTNDEVNNMTFCNFQLINRSTFTLTNTYFGQWADADLGCSTDDYVGCDVGRGLGYCYNGDNNDEDCQGAKGYGANPAAIGIDFFEGPFMDPNGADDPNQENNDPSINGLNFGDGVTDNERWGMRRFVYHTRAGTGSSNPFTDDPATASDYYNYLRGIWKDGTRMLYGGTGHYTDPTALGPECDFMFPGDTDPTNWGTQGLTPNGSGNWTEVSSGNSPGDRRFLQSAGPFTLEPGACNYITVGVVWAQSRVGNNLDAVRMMQQADDKAQALFENCFRILEGPPAPDVTIRELDREIIISLSNKSSSKNYNEMYEEGDYRIPGSDTNGVKFDTTYNFQGYMIFQVSAPDVSLSGAYDPFGFKEVWDPSKVKLIAQCDIKDSVVQIVNYFRDADVNASIPRVMVTGENQGVRHVFRVNKNVFATGDNKLINHKPYYFTVVAYGYNNYKPYDIASNTGQYESFVMSRKPRVYSAIPHKPEPENNGQKLNSMYGQMPQIRRIEGQGNGGWMLDFTGASYEEALTGPDYRTLYPWYQAGKGPVLVEVIDPVSVPKADFRLKFDSVLSSSKWTLYNLNSGESVAADQSIAVYNQQIIPKWGLALSIQQTAEPGAVDSAGTGENSSFLGASLSFSNPTHPWLTGVPDQDGGFPGMNWIRSGNKKTTTGQTDGDTKYPATGDNYLDPFEHYESVIGGTWAPARLVNRNSNGGTSSDDQYGLLHSQSIDANHMSYLSSVCIVFTPDKSKWSRCPVVETGNNVDQALHEGAASMFTLRKSLSVDKYGRTVLNGGGSGGGEEDANFIADSSMGWFPGYAVNLETGERMNVLFGEDSWQTGANGKDMLWNPTSEMFDNLGNLIYGGKHYTYILAKRTDFVTAMPSYDAGLYTYQKLSAAGTSYYNMRPVYAAAMWVTIPLLENDESLLSNEARVLINVAKPYKAYQTSVVPTNNTNPVYEFSTAGLENDMNNAEVAKSALDLIGAVPNPYYAHSAYESNQLDNRIKITNLPNKCTVSIYSVNGNLIRRFKRDVGASTSEGADVNKTTNIETSQEWDLKNSAGVPIASGVYIIHVDAPGVGEKIIKWFGILRPLDLNNF